MKSHQPQSSKVTAMTEVGTEGTLFDAIPLLIAA